MFWDPRGGGETGNNNKKKYYSLKLVFVLVMVLITSSDGDEVYTIIQYNSRSERIRVSILSIVTLPSL